MVATAALHGPSSFDGKIKQVEGANFFSTQNHTEAYVGIIFRIATHYDQFPPYSAR